MTIDGVSQSGVERLVEVTAAEAGIKLVIRDKTAELAQAEIPLGPIIDALTEKPTGEQAIGSLQIEVKRNEVLLAVGGSDAAVGLDDMMDAISSTIPA
jgi:hypothetical protein